MVKIIYTLVSLWKHKKDHDIYRWKTRVWLETSLAISPKI